MTTDRFGSYDAAYVLGALSPAERREFEDHLTLCGTCAASVAELAGLPGLMSKVSIDQLTTQPEPVPETLLASLARAVRRERGRRRLAVGATAVAAACLIAGAVAVTRPDSPARAPVTSSASTPSGSADRASSAVVPSPVTASARLVDRAWGTEIDLTCVYHPTALYPAGAVAYAMVVIDRHGAAEQVATWKALPNRTLTVMGSSAWLRRDIAAVEIRTVDGQTILRLST